jgi:hypothetical protein
VPPAELQGIVRKAIRRTLNMAAFERERKQEKVDLDAIDKRRTQLLAALEKTEEESEANETEKEKPTCSRARSSGRSAHVATESCCQPRQRQAERTI